MNDERRYQEDEVQKIFEAAAAPSDPRVPADDQGLTLAELQAIGREVGVPPERIADAAAGLETSAHPEPSRRYSVGMPVSVRRRVDLPRAPTDLEWQTLVAELRATFDAKGRDDSADGVRHWRNGNLHAFIEPTGSGYRLRLRTTKGNALTLNWMGLIWFFLALVYFVTPILSGGGADNLFSPILLTFLGAGALGWNAIRLPRWAGERERQMDHIVARAQAILGAEPEPSP